MRFLLPLSLTLLLSQSAMATTAPASGAQNVTSSPSNAAPVASSSSDASFQPAQSAAGAASGKGTLRPYLPSNQVGTQGIQSTSQGHQHGIVARALGGAITDAAHATVALVGATIGNQSPDLPPDDADNPEWPFKEPNRKALYTITWSDGSTGKISRLPDGTIQILGSGKRYMLQPIGGGSYAMVGDWGSMATVSPRMDGGFTIMNADGRVSQVIPREGGGFLIENAHGVTATILPGPSGSHHIFGGKHYATGVMQQDL